MAEEEERVREKQDLLLEMIKQRIAIQKLIKRNLQMSYGTSPVGSLLKNKPEEEQHLINLHSSSESPLSSESVNLIRRSYDKVKVEKIFLPVIFVKFDNAHAANYEV